MISFFKSLQFINSRIKKTIRKILTKHNGTAVDAAIATLFCEGVTICQSMGIGGGFFATIYDKASGKVDTMIARERAPLASTQDMFVHMPTITGILSVAVPGELKGYAEMHKKYGRVPWKTLIQPTIDLCRSGHLVTEYLERVLKMMRVDIFAEPSLKEIFVNPKTNDIWKAGDRIRRLKLAETLEIIAKEGADTMYTANGTIAKLLVKDIQERNGIITIDDLVNYEAEWKAPITAHLKGNYTVHSVPLPASGMVLALILNIMSGFEPSYSVDYFHKMIESFKYGYAKRTLFGDLPFNQSFIEQFSDMKYADKLRSLININKTFNDPKHYGAEYEMEEDHGTAQISVLAANGDAVSITSSINGM